MRLMHSRRTAAFAAGAAAMALTLGACSSDAGGDESPSGDPTSTGGTTQEASKELLVLGSTADMYGWDPANQPGYQNWAGEAVWDNLAKTNSVGGLEPDIAESWEINEDNTTFTAHIREGMTFSDGTPVDAAAVEASFIYVRDQSGSGADYTDITFDSPDDLTISITWPEPQPVLANKIAAVKIMPASYLDAANWEQPVGSGPYEFDAATSTTGSVYKFTKNEDHWNADEYPYENLEIRVIESETAAVSALKTGQIDGSLVGVGSIEEVKASGLETIQYESNTTRLIISDRTGKVIPALGDVRVRQAMNMVVDKQAMADQLYLGNAKPAYQTFREGTPAYIEMSEDPYPYDVEAAKALMEEAGYADGFELEIPTMEGQFHETLLPYVSQQLAEINITVTEVPLSGANAIGDLLSGTYPVVLWQLGNLGNSALQIYIEDTPEGWWNLQHEPNEYVDSRWDQIATASEEESATLQKEINQYITDEAWFAPMVYTGNTYAFNADKVSIPTQSDQESLHPKLRDFK
ncbi:ABC transporter substrate-binding protein [Demequina sp.]|uniref:ABC transporter substrate-binding protein n=1 Tax=Demequina sp. TaxID=2050685 RepID=UPI003A839E78